ncbi:hypothetical protein M9H77_17388 [Catharanthus roseus]|uniref:Uncharacterized protein n=1 Tax=Catharanthus roseus TaxID=4058 RepID=A0ACC0B4E8_CATRO|nr:hypothetical protein M9H77_17388 [Catharanthus roseus]
MDSSEEFLEENIGFERSRTADRRPYVTLACERRGSVKKYKKAIVDDEEEEVQKKKQGPYETKKCGCPFKLKEEQMATNESWQLFIHNGRHNYKVVVYNYGHAQAARLTEEQLHQTEQFRKSHVPPRNILLFFREQNVGCAVRRHIDHDVLAKLTEMVKDKDAAQRTWLNPFAHKFCRVWISQMLHFGVVTTNRTESEHSVLKVWLSTYHGDLDTMFLNIDSLIQGQIAEIKYTLEISKLKEKYGAKSSAILKNLGNKVSHLALKKILDELKKAREMVEEPGSNCLHYLRKSHGLPCACECIHRCQYLIPIREEDVDIFWRRLEIGSNILEQHDRDIDSEMRDLTSLIQEISMGPISKVREVRCLIKGVISPVDRNHEGRRKTNSTKRDKSHWEYLSVAHRKIGKSSGSISYSYTCEMDALCLHYRCNGNIIETNSIEWPEHLSKYLSISAKVPHAIVPQQKYSSIRTSYCSAACVPPEAG